MQWEEIFTLRIYFMILEGIRGNSIRKWLETFKNPYLKDLSKLESYQIKNHYKCKSIVFGETLGGLEKESLPNLSGIKR